MVERKRLVTGLLFHVTRISPKIRSVVASPTRSVWTENLKRRDFPASRASSAPTEALNRAIMIERINSGDMGQTFSAMKLGNTRAKIESPLRSSVDAEHENKEANGRRPATASRKRHRRRSQLIALVRQLELRRGSKRPAAAHAFSAAASPAKIGLISDRPGGAARRNAAGVVSLPAPAGPKLRPDCGAPDVSLWKSARKCSRDTRLAFASRRIIAAVPNCK